MIINHPRRAEILKELGERCRAASINFYKIELCPHPSWGWDARLSVAGGNLQNELTFLQIVNDVREKFKA